MRPKLVTTIGAAFIVVAVGIGTTSTLATPAHAASSASADVTATGQITGYTGLCLDDRAASTANFNPIQAYTCNGSAAQSWTVDSTTNTLGVLGKCLDI